MDPVAYNRFFGRWPEPLGRFVVESTGSSQLRVNAATAALSFAIGPKGNEEWLVSKLHWSLSASGSFGAWTNFGSRAILQNGVLAAYERKGRPPVDLLDGRPILCNAHFMEHFSAFNLLSFGGGVNGLSSTLLLDTVLLKAGDRIVCTIQDDLSSLTSFACKVLGIVHKPGT